MTSFDTVVVGAGSAGCVLAARLSEDSGRRVCLIEAGGRGRDPLLRVPLMTGLLLRGRRHNWSYETEPVPGLGGRRSGWAKGRVLGGSSAINGMVYVRGLPQDYDAWAQRGLAGWSFADLFPYFVRAEDCADGAPGWHGAGGPMTVSRRPPSNPLFDVFRAAARDAGWPETDDFNGPAPAGIGRYHFSIRDGRRWSSRQAFLDPAMGRPNLTVITDAGVGRVTIADGRATGVEVARRGGAETVGAGEVVLCAGAVASPQLLMLSGIGPADALAAHGLRCRVDSPEVGRNLQDHVLVRVSHACLKPVTLHRLTRPDRGALALARALLLGTGPASTFPLETGGYLASDRALDGPDLQVHFLPGTTTGAVRWNPFARPASAAEGHGFMANVSLMRPLSRGFVALRSADPADPPVIQPNYLAEPGDVAKLRAGVRILREIFAQAAFDGWRGDELQPGEAVRSDAALDAWIRATADTVYHACGSCRMGADDRAVVDGALRVRGVDGLRVADASVFPAIPSNNTHAPTVAVAEKAADLIRGRPAPPPHDPRDGR